MQKLRLFLLVLTVAAGALLVLVGLSWYWALSSQSYYQSSWMDQMWGGMMGGRGMMGDSGTGLWIIPVGLIAVLIFGIIGVSFYLLYPEITSSKNSCAPSRTELGQPFSLAAAGGNAESKVDSGSTACEVLLKTMTPEEQKVLNVLRAHQGTYLQKYIGKEAGLNRLKTHRIIARFAQRGIVTAKEVGNTNEISLSEWVKNSEMQKTTGNLTSEGERVY